MKSAKRIFAIVVGSGAIATVTAVVAAAANGLK